MGVSLSAVWTQIFPPKDRAPITEKNLGSQKGKVFIVTGGSSGIGYELTKLLYAAGAKVYILSRTPANVDAAIQRIEEAYADVDKSDLGSLHFVPLDLEDLESVRDAARSFKEKETRLDVLFCNAGLAAVPGNKRTKQGIEMHLGVNTVAHVLLERSLLPILTATAKVAPKDSVRVVWSASIVVDCMAPTGGVPPSFLETPGTNIGVKYSISKTAAWFSASQLAREHGRESGVVNIAGNPGTYFTNVWRFTPTIISYVFRFFMRDTVFGAYTYLWMGFSNEVTMEAAEEGRYGICDGRWHPGQREDLVLANLAVEDGGTGEAKRYMEWVDEKIGPFLDV
ncbi:NAD(P)-binding protein [Aaosphaeria arxii CBS 175.79]|uniref:NAD(P)-binding protein n=1 Tax=Aaosphaeria arxii CBS 175.79 TaxID=1450172 RepID=A0A6A5XBH7_9PLEO|nr:NAD(P)-binding protein [Aaosphaeria arxii CBS 175.79]KAF2010157.1 NAD(P)-binding protein [Aaosphaeria arxii CBS 175.79]